MPPLRILFVPGPRGDCSEAMMRAAVACSGLARAVVGGRGSALARSISDREPLAEQGPLRDLAFQVPAHARSHAILAAIRRAHAARAVGAVVFDAATDAFSTVEARRLTGELQEVAIAVRPPAGPAGDDALVTREAIVERALERGAVSGADWLLSAQPTPADGRSAGDAGGVPPAIDPAELARAIADGRRPPPAPPATSAPLVSVIVPHFNLGEYVGAAVESALASTYRNVEVVVVDDGSTDPRSVAAVEALRGDRVATLRIPHGGASAARNAGLRVARGELVLPLDADDLVDARYIEAAVIAHQRTPGMAFVTCHAAFFRKRPGDLRGEGFVPLGLDGASLLLGNSASTCSAVIRRDALAAVGGYDESWGDYEDWDLWCSMAERGMTSGVLPEPWFHYRIRPKSMVRSIPAERDRALRSRIVRKHAALARAHAVTALLAHVAGCPVPDMRVIPGARKA